MLWAGGSLGGLGLQVGLPGGGALWECPRQVAVTLLDRGAFGQHHLLLGPHCRLRQDGLPPDQSRPNAAPERQWPGHGRSAGLPW